MSLNEKKLIPAKGLVDPPNHMTVTGVKHASMDCAGDDLNSPQSKEKTIDQQRVSFKLLYGSSRSVWEIPCVMTQIRSR